MLAWMGGSRKKLKEAKNRRFGGGGLSPKVKKISKCKVSSPKKTPVRILKSTPFKSPSKGTNNPFERQCQAIAQGTEYISNPVGPSHKFYDGTRNINQNTNVENNGNNLHSKQFQLLLGVGETDQTDKVQRNVREQSKIQKSEKKVVELSPVFQGSLDLLVIQMPAECDIAEMDEDSLQLSDGDLDLELE